ncbi:MAG: hypothetical protein COV36_03150, partial [Alphaproteobacteria bacterium CG11_big_fil_rev_8_21_14_0_20_44_7]
SEFIGFFNLGVEALNEKKGDADAQKQFRVFPHKITILTDKDATLEDPSRALLQSPRETEADQYSPDHAEQLIRQAHRGATIYILTGSSALEAWRDIYVPVLAVIGRMGLSRFEQRIALERIVVLANDGASVLSVNTDQEPFESSIAHNDLYSKSGWSPLATLYRRHPTRGTEDAAYRAISWNVSVQSFLKQLFSEQRLQNLMSWPTDEEERRRKKTSLDAFIDQLELKTTDLPDMSRMN